MTSEWNDIVPGIQVNHSNQVKAHSKKAEEIAVIIGGHFGGGALALGVVVCVDNARYCDPRACLEQASVNEPIKYSCEIENKENSKKYNV